jgi:acetyl-CoA carboxylase biotin carboxyl carrier protein
MRKRPTPARRGGAKPPAPARAPQYEDILAIARLIEAGSRFTEFRLRSGDIEVEVKRANGAAAPQPGPWAPAASPEPSAIHSNAGTRPSDPGKGPGTAAVKPASNAALPDLPAGTHVIRSPMVGTFYRAPEPGAKPFVEPGTKVAAGSIVCIIEVMKLMNSVEAGVEGTVTHVFVENATIVEHDQPLIAIRP